MRIANKRVYSAKWAADYIVCLDQARNGYDVYELEDFCNTTPRPEDRKRDKGLKINLQNYPNYEIAYRKYDMAYSGREYLTETIEYCIEATKLH